MIEVSCSHELPYFFVGSRPLPLLRLEVSSSENPDNAITVEAHLDSGTDRTIFRGDICSVIGLELMEGREHTFRSAIVQGGTLSARIHRARISHEILGERIMDVAFATGDLARNLLGLDFFNYFKIGFQDRENRMLFEPE